MRILNERYALQEQYRAGGMSVVYPAHDLRSNARKVAVKLFQSRTLDNDIIKEAYDREIRALHELKHPNIVELLDHGTDKETGHHFLVLEWVDSDLWTQLASSEFLGWDSFYFEFGRPLLQALEFAHSRQVIHRDLKPKNILVDSSRTPKLADFGISKLKRWLEPGLTLNEFASRPFCPQELDEGSHTYTRDVYGFAALCLQCLSRKQFQSYDDLYLALDSVDLPPEIHTVLSKALSVSPSERYLNANVLFAAIEQIQLSRQKSWLKRTDLYLEVSGLALRQLQKEFSSKTYDEIISFVIADLNAGFGMVRFENQLPGGTDQFSVFASSLSYHLAVHREAKNRLVVLNARPVSASLLEQRRERAFQPLVRFISGQPEVPEVGLNNLLSVLELLEEFETEQRRSELEFREQELFRTWASILKVKTSLEKEKEKAIRFNRSQIIDNRVLFQTQAPIPDDIIGEIRVIDAENRRLLTGYVEEIHGTTVILSILRLSTNELPNPGELTVDISAAREALNRQKSAVDDVRFDRAIRSDLRSLLVHPERCKIPVSASPASFFQKDLDSPKREAVARALASEDFLLVQGPPGTGKTTFITELILQTLKTNPKARILLTSQTHVALDNAVERLQEHNDGFRIVRIGKGDNARISKSVEKLLIERQIDGWRTEVMERGRKYLREWAEKHGISREQYEVSTNLRLISVVLRELMEVKIEIQKTHQDAARFAALSKQDVSEEAADEKPVEPDVAIDEEHVLDDVADELQTVEDYLSLDTDSIEEGLKGTEAQAAKLKEEKAGLEQRLKALWADMKRIEPDVAKDLERSEPEELDTWAETYMPDNEESRRFKQLVETHSEWEARLGRAADFEAALIASSQVVAGTCVGIAGAKGIKDLEFDLCIVDEASKATPTETLVPVSRARKWVLVGDSKQLPPFVEEGLADKQLLTANHLDERSLRATLFDRLEQLLPGGCITALNMQHRMVPQIGNLISDCFYGGMLISAKKEWDKTFQSVIPKPVVWFTTSSSLQRLESPSGSSFTNTHEARLIADLLERMQRFAERANRKYSVSVLTGYSEQKRLLERTLAKSQFTSLDVSFNTVDTVQGRQFDVAIYSVTRSNDRRKLGFLSELRRLNVALSRGRQYLVLVGDHVFARSAEGENPFRRVVEYIEDHPEDCSIRDFKN